MPLRTIDNQTRDGADVDDRAGTAFRHFRRDRLAGFPDRLEVHGEQPSPLLIGDLESLDVKTDPRVVDQDVDGSESALNGADHAENVVPLRQIRPDCEGAGAELFKLRDSLSVSLFVTRSDRDGRSRFRQSDGDRAADT